MSFRPFLKQPSLDIIYLLLALLIQLISRLQISRKYYRKIIFFSSRYSDGAKTISITPTTTVIISSPPTHSPDVCDSQLNNQNSEYEEMINSMKLQQTSLLDELKRLREVYEQAKSDSLDQIRQIKTLEDYYTNQYEISTNEQIEYLIKILNLFQNLRGLNENFTEDNYSSINDLKNQLNQQMIYFSTLDKTLILNNNNNNNNNNHHHHQNDEKQIVSKVQSNNLSIFLTKFEQKFSYLFNNNNNTNPSNELDETIENENDDELDLIINEDLLLKKFSTFLNDIYEKIKNLLRDKNELDEKLIFLEEKRLTYSRWETQMYDILKWINEEKSARSHLKGLANKMAEELDQIRETTSPLITIGSTSSSMATAGTSLGHNTVSLISLYCIPTDKQNRVRPSGTRIVEPGPNSNRDPGPVRTRSRLESGSSPNSVVTGIRTRRSVWV